VIVHAVHELYIVTSSFNTVDDFPDTRSVAVGRVGVSSPPRWLSFCLCLSASRIIQKVVDKTWRFFWIGGMCDSASRSGSSNF